MEEVVPGVLEADGGHAWDCLAAVHQVVDASIVSTERSRINVHWRGEAPGVELDIPDGARAQVLELHLEHRVPTGYDDAWVEGLHLDARRVASLAIGSWSRYLFG